MLDRPATHHWEFPRSAAGLVLVLEFAEAHGVPTDVLLDGVELDSNLLREPSAVVPAAVELSLLGNLASALADEETPGLDLGRRYHLTAFGVLGYALMSSRTVAEAMDLALRFLDLSHAFTVPEVTVDGQEVAVTLRAVDLPPAPGALPGRAGRGRHPHGARADRARGSAVHGRGPGLPAAPARGAVPQGPGGPPTLRRAR